MTTAAGTKSSIYVMRCTVTSWVNDNWAWVSRGIAISCTKGSRHRPEGQSWERTRL